MSLQGDALEFIRHLQTLYFAQGGLEAILEVVLPDAVWIEPDAPVSSRGADGIRRALAGAGRSWPERSLIVREDYQASELSEDLCAVSGEMQSEDGAVVRMSAVCVRTDAGMRLAQMHLSRPERGDACYHFHAPELCAMTESVPGGVHQCLYDGHLTLLGVSRNFLGLTGYTRAELREQFQDHFLEVVYAEDRPRLLEQLRKQLSRGDRVELEYRIERKDGEIRWMMDQAKLASAAGGQPCLYCIMLDITRQKREQEELRLSLERHQIIMNQSTDIIFEWDIVQDSLLFSANWLKKFGYGPVRSQVQRKLPLSQNIHPDDMPALLRLMRDTAAGAPYAESELRIRDVTGQYTWNRIRATVQYDDSHRAIKAVGVILDIDEDRRQKLKLMEQAEKDSLTGLLNKETVKRRFTKAVHAPGVSVGTMFILDLDDFKQINDCYGHLCGDAVLSDAAAALKRLFRSTDVVGRIGGDEFLMFTPGLYGHAAADKAAEVIRAVSCIQPRGADHSLSCSIGSAALPEDARDFYNLYHCADCALYHVKNAGKGGYAAYAAGMSAEKISSGAVRSVVGTVIDSDAGEVNVKLVNYSFRMLYHAVDIQSAVEQLLEIVGRAYDVSRVYIFESSEDGLRCSNTFEWCGPGVEPEMDTLQNLSYQDDLGDYLSNFDENGVFYCQDIKALHPKLYQVLKPQGIFSLLQCAIMDDGRFRGYVGFDECRDNRYWVREQIESLELIANVLSTFLTKLRLRQQLDRLTGQGATPAQ